MTTRVDIKSQAGSFAENKDVAREIREMMLKPALRLGETVVFDFTGVDGVTQSFIHALISDSIRHYGGEFYDMVEFKNCSEVVREVINIVADYMSASAE